MPTVSTGNKNSGIRIDEISVRLSRSASVSSFRYTMPTLRSDMSVILRRRHIVWRHDLDKNLLEVALAIFCAQIVKRAFGEQLAALNNPDHVAQFLDFAHDVRRKNNGFAEVAAFADERGDRPGRHDVEPERRLVEDHHRRIVYQRSCDRRFLLHARR